MNEFEMQKKNKSIQL